MESRISTENSTNINARKGNRAASLIALTIALFVLPTVAEDRNALLQPAAMAKTMASASTQCADSHAPNPTDAWLTLSNLSA
jgi:hypothetical protein